MEFKDKDSNLTSTLKIEVFRSFLVSSSTDLLHAVSSDLGAGSTLYDKLSNKKIGGERRERVLKGTMRERKGP